MHKILIVEDDAFIAKMYQTKLHQLGYDARIAENGQEALQVSEEWMPDVILLDLIMPVLDGFETLKKLKSNNKLKHIRVIILSNLGEKENTEKGLDLGASDYIIKANFTPTQVVEKIEKCLQSQN